ncbi:CYFA0S25e01530g1_1 [Cyberlindnera fabianii]|uniref:Vacuolar protein sorting-associated protein 28 n=1 Tax=Cyberlindnera fabianii TaxID=36022 RepID=A0A061B9W8_CYBFA|nr:CYFA0S25e01530g1_1 [Cyberlindnera fabianii]
MSLPPYAPTSTRAPSQARFQGSHINLDEPVSLYNTSQQRETQESLAELYSIITVLDIVEKAYVKDTLNSGDKDEYTPMVLRLLAQYNTLLKNSEVQQVFGSLDQFKKRYGLNVPQATSRIEIGVPATVEHAVNMPALSSNSTGTGTGGAGVGTTSGTGGSTGLGGPGGSARAVAEATGNFITVMDALKLNYRAKDQLHPLLSDVMTSVNKVSSKEFEGRARIIEWLIKINKMNVYDELNDDDTRQLLFDLDNAYKGFYTMLE